MARFKHYLTFVERKGLIALNVKSEADAVKVARMIAEETGCAIIVRDDQLDEIERIAPPQRH